MLLRLRPLNIHDEAAGRAAHAELAQEDFLFLWDLQPQAPWSSYLARLHDLRRGTAMPAGHTPATLLVAEVDGVLVGRVSIRHELNEFLADVGGHVGFGVRPQYRRRGFATEMLRQALVIARAEGVDWVLVTCDENNRASAIVIERLGGSLEDVRLDPEGIRKRRYWIRLAHPAGVAMIEFASQNAVAHTLTLAPLRQREGYAPTPPAVRTGIRYPRDLGRNGPRTTIRRAKGSC